MDLNGREWDMCNECIFFWPNGDAASENVEMEERLSVDVLAQCALHTARPPSARGSPFSEERTRVRAHGEGGTRERRGGKERDADDRIHQKNAKRDRVDIEGKRPQGIGVV